jgi:hypothetical protein
MKLMKVPVRVLVAISLLLMFVSSSCLLKHEVNQSQDVKTAVISETPIKIYWVEENGWLQTNDYERLQKTLPYTIISPKSLPAELQERLPQLTRSSISIQTLTETDLIEEEVVEVGIKYQSWTGGYKAVEIIENNSAYPWPKLDQDQIWDFSGIQIEETISIDENLSKEEKGEVTDISYLWYWHKTRFVAYILGYSQAESRKIIASMFDI